LSYANRRLWETDSGFQVASPNQKSTRHQLLATRRRRFHPSSFILHPSSFILGYPTTLLQKVRHLASYSRIANSQI
jgi:hypothetical protein